MSIYDEVAELIWDNGNLSMHGLSGLQPTSDERPSLNRAQDTLESLVQQGTCQHQIQKPKYILKEIAPTSVSSIDASSRKDNDTTLMTWTSRESGRSLDNTQEDSDRHCGSDIRDNQDERGIKGEIGRTNSKRRNRIAAIHNQSERKRRDRINQKLKELQRLVPNANKTDKASMLDEVINYLKQLQSQIQIMNMTRMSHMMMPLAMQQQQQQQLQMSMLARMGMVNINNMVPHNPMFVSPSFMMPSLIQPHSSAATKVSPSASSRINASIPLPDPYSTNLAQSVNMDILNFSALYKNQMRQKNGAIDSTTQ